ncbi:MAG: WD40 repeat domain-containing protein [Pyrinomonadaceae bacterium]
MRGLPSESSENQVKIWNVKAGRELRTLVPSNNAIDAGFSADGRMLAILDSMGKILLWDTASDSKLRDLSANGRTVTSFAFSRRELKDES